MTIKTSDLVREKLASFFIRIGMVPLAAVVFPVKRIDRILDDIEEDIAKIDLELAKILKERRSKHTRRSIERLLREENENI